MSERLKFVAPTPVPRFRRLPPAVFPALLGLLGLVVAWYRAAHAFALPTPIIDVFAGAVTLLYLFFAALYVVKLAHRPAVVMEDAAILPGRTGIAAMALGLIVLASLPTAFGPLFARVALMAGVAVLVGLALWVLPRRLKGNDTAGPITPAMHLVFVGFILVPTAAVPMGLALPVMPWLIGYCVIAALIIAAPTIGQLAFATGAPPLRPLHAIQLAPPAFVASCLFLIGAERLGAASLIVAVAIAGLLVYRLRWLVEGGFSPMWAAFTFPVTALAGALFLGAGALDLPLLRIAGAIVLLAATLFIPVIAFKVLKLWASGVLAVKTNAATA